MAAQILRQTVQFLHITVFQERLQFESAVRYSFTALYYCKSYTSTSATPVVLFTPRTIAV